MTGRPLRFLVMTVGGWTLVRASMLWPTVDSFPELIRALAPPVAAATAFYAEAPRPVVASIAPGGAPAPVRSLPSAPVLHPTVSDPPPPIPDEPLEPPPLRLAPLASPDRPNRLAISVWAIARGGSGPASPGTQLGGSQAGVRVTYALGATRRLALAARVSTPLEGRGREAVFGIDWQPTSAPVHVIAEQRIAIGPGRGGPAVFVAAGLDPRPLPAGFRIEGYAQAGGVLRDRIDGFADGAARVTRPALRHGAMRLELGVGGWAGIQREAARLDIGPTAALVVPVADRALRLTLDWRQRIAGRARPASGPALTIGGDF